MSETSGSLEIYQNHIEPGLTIPLTPDQANLASYQATLGLSTKECAQLTIKAIPPNLLGRILGVKDSRNLERWQNGQSIKEPQTVTNLRAVTRMVGMCYLTDTRFDVLANYFSNPCPMLEEQTPADLFLSNPLSILRTFKEVLNKEPKHNSNKPTE